MLAGMYPNQYAHRRDNGTFWDISASAVCTRHAGPGEVLEVSVTEDPEGPYWGWEDAETKRASFIFSSKLHLSVCFPYGIQAEIDAGRGRVLRLRVEEIPKP